MLDRYDMSKNEKKTFIKDTLSTVNNSIHIVDEYMDFVKFQFAKKLKYEKVDLYELLVEIKKELNPFIKEKSINMYIQKTDVKILSNRFWLKRAIYNIVFNAIKYNKVGGSISIKVENDIFGIYLSISDTGIGMSTKDLSSVFKMFKQLDDTKKGVGIGLALSKSVIESFGGKINVKSNENVGTNFILYIPKKPKEVTMKKIAFGLIPASIALFLGVSYFPIYSQDYVKNETGRYIVYKLEDGSILKYTKDSEYDLKLYKNLYKTKYILKTTLHNGDMSLKAIKNKASIIVDGREFNNLGTDFEIIKDLKAKIAVFEGKVKTNQVMLKKGDGGIVDNSHIKVVNLLPAPKNIKIENNILEFTRTNSQIKYKVIVSYDKNFANIQSTLFSVNNKIPLSFDEDTLYYIKVFAYDKYDLPSMPGVIKYVSLNHYKKALELEDKGDVNQAIIELKDSISTIQNYSSLPYYELAKIYFYDLKYKESLKYIKKAISIEPKKEYYYLLFDNYFRLNELDKFTKLDKLIKKYPNDMKFLFYKALLLYKNKEYDEASKILFKILQQKPDFKEANLLMSKVLLKLNKKEEAKYYERLAK